MERRDALKYTAYFMGIGLSASSISVMLAGCEVDTSDDWIPTFYSFEEAAFIRELSETMLPRTHTPGAKDAKVDRYLDTIRPLRYTVEENITYKEQLSIFIEEANAYFGKTFIKAKPEFQLEWLTTIDKAAYAVLQADPKLPDDKRPFYLSLKEQILSAYFNSEVVAKEYFAFDPIPGRYDPCIPYEEIGKAWA
ncbi:MAG TPA: gluconate 2-dehydrogenase subunit 3 family protein [Saprospiraceae bacterium]